MTEYTLRRQENDFQDSLPVPLEEQRPLPLAPAQDVCAQFNSILFTRVPPELRIAIWEHAIGGQKIHIIHKYRRLGHAVCDSKYWAEKRSKRPDLRASSYMYTYASLPSRKQLANWSMCSLLLTCRKIYEEAVSFLYQSNTFVFWDLRTIEIFKRGILPCRWRSIRSVEIYAMCYRVEDNEEATQPRSLLQLEAWPSSSSALATLPNLRHMRVFVGNSLYLDRNYLNGWRRATPYASTFAFLERLKGLKVTCEILIPAKRKDGERERCLWNLRAMNDVDTKRLSSELRSDGLNCSVCIGDFRLTEEEMERQEYEMLAKSRLASYVGHSWVQWSARKTNMQAGMERRS